ncbi:hypothetical protein CONPUDRAFT_75220 [Coniophora puteana RWD-64-598 SS2]|uniref:BUB1 N-terminal domain-containing protein n=1 Tax=Coniophora puteana (strain RWD-64-598) TaxID=741705 RepID=A0A5M3MIH3_CONPW|nr:uncharacterized protein CONPUDRAFT_75220 [Coniophora puteana RWD-64-598 SS2]EIW78584.1 hypothetical protein CONPUDRAFT_75220 [Coniophora puteana RWD-64-598 SS2]
MPSMEDTNDHALSSSSEESADVADGNSGKVTSKENIQSESRPKGPLKTIPFSTLLSTPLAQRDINLLVAKHKHQASVADALKNEDGDLLEAYCRFVDWTLENYPDGQSAESGLIELLEEATRVLKENRGGKWKGKIEYLKLWTLYASYVEKPAIIFKFLLANDIGTTHALLYEEHANALEKAGRHADADDAYLLGITRQASPLEHLQSKHRELQKRMLSSGSPPPSESTDVYSAQQQPSFTRFANHEPSTSTASSLSAAPVIPGMVLLRAPDTTEDVTAPSTVAPTITPAIDETTAARVSTTGNVHGTIIGSGSKGLGPAVINVADIYIEALRKNPLKNYSSTEPGVEHVE